LRVDGTVLHVIQAPKLEFRIMRHELSDFEWAAIKPMLPPNKPRDAPRVNVRRIPGEKSLSDGADCSTRWISRQRRNGRETKNFWKTARASGRLKARST